MLTFMSNLKRPLQHNPFQKKCQECGANTAKLVKLGIHKIVKNYFCEECFIKLYGAGFLEYTKRNNRAQMPKMQ